MERCVHQENLAHYRRLLVETKLATSKDEIHHSMLMRLLAEEEAKELLMPVDGTGQRLVSTEQSDGARTQLNQTSMSDSVMVSCIEHPLKFSTACGLFCTSQSVSLSRVSNIDHGGSTRRWQSYTHHRDYR